MSSSGAHEIPSLSRLISIHHIISPLFIQSLLYLVHVETSSDSHARFADVLTPNPSQKIDILSFSFMLPSCVLAVDSHVCFIFRQGLSLGIVHPLSDSELPAICATACKAAVVSP